MGLGPKLNLRRQNANPQDWSSSLTVGTEISRDRAAQLKQKSVVHITGTIREISIDKKTAIYSGGARVVIVIGEVQGK